ncbi:MAG: hypothetical protein H0U12_02330 [Thermoleophilaceae bacterium]|nr:hypothetical protein [Thermoleophilaceae bacterium]
MSTRATALSDDAKVLRVLRYLDLGALVVALPLFLLAGLPMLGYAVAAGAWILQRGARELIQRRAMAASDVRTAAGLTAASMIVRGWVVALAIFAVGLSDSEAGLAAAVLFLFLFTLAFTMQAILRPLGTTPASRGRR